MISPAAGKDMSLLITVMLSCIAVVRESLPLALIIILVLSECHQADCGACMSVASAYHAPASLCTLDVLKWQYMQEFMMSVRAII